MDKHGLLKSTFGESWDYWMDGITSAEGWVWRNWAIENRMTVWGTGYERVGLGYVGQEREKLLNHGRIRR